jgi:hypothetical protein
MPGRLTKVIKNLDEALQVINDKKEIFSVNFKGNIDNNFLNDVISFPPIFMNVDIKTNEETIGKTMYEYMEANGISRDTKERRLIQLTDTHNLYRLINCYMLWFLILHN